jgi:hypothetical protein
MFFLVHLKNILKSRPIMPTELLLKALSFLFLSLNLTVVILMKNAFRVLIAVYKKRDVLLEFDH